jgi:L-ribulose-5-phosphate 3-epimerase UlaE
MMSPIWYLAIPLAASTTSAQHNNQGTFSHFREHSVNFRGHSVDFREHAVNFREHSIREIQSCGGEISLKRIVLYVHEYTKRWSLVYPQIRNLSPPLTKRYTNLTERYTNVTKRYTNATPAVTERLTTSHQELHKCHTPIDNKTLHNILLDK